jgi:DivIVA domain-containing protein
MEMNPQQVRSAEFKTVRKGADPDEVRVFLDDVADELERAQNQSTAMEARARAAVARLQEQSDGARSEAAALITEAATAPAHAPIEASADEADTISRTLLLAQRTADTAVSDARTEAARILQAASDESAATLDSTREMSALLLAEAREEARGVGEAERIAIAGEVDSLMARRDFLESDVDHLETFLVDQRARVRDAATSLMEVAERVPGGLGDIRRPLLSASDDEGGHQATGQDAYSDNADDADLVPDSADAETSDAETSDVETSDVETSDVETSDVETSDAEIAEAELAEAASVEDGNIQVVNAAGADSVADDPEGVEAGEDRDLDDDIANVVAQIAASKENSEESAGWAQSPIEEEPNGDDDEFRFSFENERN